MKHGNGDQEERGAVESIGEGLAQIEAAVEAGASDLRALGFWKLVSRIKSDPALSEQWADPVGRIDRRAFENGIRLRVPVPVGNTLLLVGLLAGAAAVVVAMRSADPLVAGLALLLAGGVWSVAVHCPAHWLVGNLSGIRFTHYFLGGPFPPRPGLKTDYASYLRAPAAARARMHASGALATKAAPFAALALFPASAAPAWAAWGLVALGLVQIATDVVFSRRSSDWKKVARERRIARRPSGGGPAGEPAGRG